jgi:hypothetical protein
MKTKPHTTFTVNKWTIRIVEVGQAHGRNDCLINDKETLVEFYDNTQSKADFGELGQMVSSYYLTTLVNKECMKKDLRFDRRNAGLDLCGYEPSWQVSAEEMDAIVEKLASISGAKYVAKYKKHKKTNW